MRSIDFIKIASILLFLALAGLSCYWTATSLFRWFPTLTIYGAWLIAIVFFIVASLCFSMLLKTLDRHEDFYNSTPGRGGWLLLSFLGLVVFWIVFSLPTNTHTQLYNVSVKNVLLTDLQRTQGYLNDLQNNNKAIRQIQAKYQETEGNARALLIKMTMEMQRPDIPGIGSRFNAILNELEVVLSQEGKPFQFRRVEKVGNTRNAWQVAYKLYENATYAQLENIKAASQRDIEVVRNNMNSAELGRLNDNITNSLREISSMNRVEDNLITQAEDDLEAAYTFIKTNAQYIDFRDNDAQIYTAQVALPEAKGLHSVWNVWKDFLTTDKFSGNGFVWMILIALLVDLAGFIFFNIAFNRKSNNAIA